MDGDQRKYSCNTASEMCIKERWVCHVIEMIQGEKEALFVWRNNAYEAYGCLLYSCTQNNTEWHLDQRKNSCKQKIIFK